MRKTVIAVVLLVGSNNLGAVESQKGFKIETHFGYKSTEKEIKSQNTYIFSKDHKAWVALTEPKKGVALLGRVVRSDKKSLHLEYIVVDTDRKNSGILTPSITANIGEKAEITVSSGPGQDKVAISLLATEAEYSGN